ncbi:MAG TPA: biotin/lipoyl-containing protein, partial [Fimbriimonas sp.]|nr:biotin/lipoyl-containing protein [Fimbriimonas sp.]
MSIVSVTIPQIGEGLQEARIVSFLKKPGDFVKRDEPLYQMETDKAVMDVESPFEGTLVSWSAKVDDVVPIGGEIAQFEVGGAAPAATPVSSSSSSAAAADAPAEFALTIPQIGEGLQEARIVAFLKQPGDSIKRDEPIYQMETDKAIMDVESPVEGTLIEWTAKVDQVVAIGAAIGRVAIVGAAPAP